MDDIQQEELAKALKALAEAVERQTLTEEHRRREAQRLHAERQRAKEQQEAAWRPTAAFPFSAVEWLLHSGLLQLELAVRRVVAAMFR